MGGDAFYDAGNTRIAFASEISLAGKAALTSDTCRTGRSASLEDGANSCFQRRPHRLQRSMLPALNDNVAADNDGVDVGTGSRKNYVGERIAAARAGSSG